MNKTTGSIYSRRGLFRGAAVIAGGGALAAAGLGSGSASAQGAKAPQNAAQYQTTPKGKQRCETCVAFVAPSSCNVVAGTISPSGWCVMYAAKG
jgi:hypothetical protein